MELGLAGKAVLVPASSRGLGRAVALGFAREGARVALCGRDSSAIEAATAEIRDLGADVVPMRADLRNADDITRFVKSAVERFGEIDVLVANAGGSPAGTFDRFDDDDWRAAYPACL